MAQRLRHLSPLALLVALSLLSVAARLAWLEQPCRSPCRSARDHLLVFDEDYYVNAARVIAGLRPPADAPYAMAPAGSDPNAEHPQLAKLIVAGSIELFGDGPLAWRLGSVVFGSLAILGLFVLVRAAGGGGWLALGAAALMAADNLLLVHGRIGTLDIFAVAAMLWGAAFYLRRRPWLAGAVIGFGACFKLVAPYVLLVLALVEILRSLAGEGAAIRRWRSFAVAAVTAVVVYVAALGVLDAIARPYDAAVHKFVNGGPIAHLSHMVSYAAGQSSPHGPQGIASYPWEWLGDYKPITYLNINPGRPATGLFDIHPAVHFLGMISPPIMLLALPALLLCALGVATPVRLARLWPARLRPARLRLARRVGGELEIVGLGWFLGTFLPFEALSLFWSRTSYIYYMVIVMPGIYIAVASLVARARSRWMRRLAVLWGFAVLLAAIALYPFTPTPF